MDTLTWMIEAEHPARTYIQQLCANTGCSLQILPEVMDNREGWWEMMMMMVVVSLGHSCFVVYYQRHPGFGLVSPCPFHKMITITPWEPPKWSSCNTLAPTRLDGQLQWPESINWLDNPKHLFDCPDCILEMALVTNKYSTLFLF